MKATDAVLVDAPIVALTVALLAVLALTSVTDATPEAFVTEVALESIPAVVDQLTCSPAPRGLLFASMTTAVMVLVEDPLATIEVEKL